MLRAVCAAGLHGDDQGSLPPGSNATQFLDTVLKEAKMSAEVLNVIGKWLTGLAAIVTAGVALWQYLDQRKFEIDTRQMEIVALDRQSKQKFLDKKFELYTEVVALMSRLAASAEYQDREADRDRFWQLYWGELGMVEDSQVERAMKAAGDALTATGDLTFPSLHLSRCISKSIEVNWGVKLETGACPYSD